MNKLATHQGSHVISLYFRLTKLAALVFLMSGCVTVTLIDPTDMKPVAAGQTLEIKEPITFTYTAGLNVLREESLLPGQYRGVGDDGHGIWYLGSDRALKVTVLDRGGAIGFPKDKIGVPTYSRGGIFVPHNAKQQPKIFTIYGRAAPAPPNTATSDGISDTTRNAISANPVLGNATPMQAGIASGVATGIVGAIIEADKKDWGKFWLSPWQPPEGTDLRRHITIVDAR